MKSIYLIKFVGELQNPEGARLNSKRPCLVTKAVYFLLSPSIGTWKKPYSKSIVSKYFAPYSFINTSSIIGTGKQSFENDFLTI